MVTNTGVIGLGAMGLQMARHMVNKGFAVAGYDISPEAMQQAESVGVRLFGSPAEVGRAAQVVIVMAQTDAQVEDIVCWSGLLQTLAKGAVICVASSTSSELSARLEEAGQKHGIGVLDTPVVLGQEAANNGTLTVLVGGEAAALETARPVLQAFGEHIIHLGKAGNGQIGKTVNNLLLWSCICANYEALSLARTLGADIPLLVKAMAHCSGANWSLSRWGKSTGKWSEKDMDVALDTAQAAKVPVPLFGLVDQLVKNINQEKMKALLN